ncbi:hypothetical protein [Pseudovibrio sp. Ad37]|uniref:hypothetical protein n=1 Tax=Pseudovibrio sp. Ad37 TaxID=989422 RepID=UPI0007AE859F|nr:hypothetical protein [Pseudovibrio sp. Ad37]KZL22454.1 hypothetical protein PsAD37_03434 [Pseudovibrio sp. Ad37]
MKLTITYEQLPTFGLQSDDTYAKAQTRHFSCLRVTRDSAFTVTADGLSSFVLTGTVAKTGVSTNEAKAYREKQRKLLEEGKLKEAVQMDLDDIRNKFGDKYDDAIKEMLDYVDSLDPEDFIPRK